MAIPDMGLSREIAPEEYTHMKRKPNSSDRLLKEQVALYLEPEQAAALRELSARTRVPQQVYLREGLGWVLKKYRGPLRIIS